MTGELTSERLAEIRSKLAAAFTGDQTKAVFSAEMVRDLLAHLDYLTAERDAYRDHPAILFTPSSPAGDKA